MSKLSAMIRAPGLVISRNRFSSCRACLKLPKSPKLLPIIRIVSNLPRLESISEIDLTMTLFRPLSLQTLTANGEFCPSRSALPSSHGCSSPCIRRGSILEGLGWDRCSHRPVPHTLLLDDL